MTTLRESIVHGLRMAGWTKIDAEDEADRRIARRSCEHDFQTLPQTGGLIDRCTKCGEERA